ncbi:MAG: hypothetical protein EOO07_05770 [Chitinophagaceae bacterium]|nr:MAG: hypothetical protein EOO07_05770 [Chitinophagaceae bacterium]
MKKLLLLFGICISLACKKDIENLTNERFVLREATISPAMVINGKAETNAMTMYGGACLNYNYTLTFKGDGTYTISSNGPLCDMLANTSAQKWSKEGNKVTLTHPYVPTIVATIDGDNLVYTTSSKNGGVSYSTIYKFEAK